MRRALISLFAAAALVGGGMAPAQAASALQFRTWVADPSGADRAGDNRQINRETIQVKNTGSKAISMAGYRIKDRAGHTFVFPKGFSLRAGATVTVHSGKGSNTSSHLYWKQGNYVWNNTGDTAYLSKPSGTRLDTCVYRSGGSITC